MTTYVGYAENKQAGGRIIVSINDTGIVTGNVKIGAPPTSAFTGFSGRIDGVGGFTAGGVNKTTAGTQTPYDDITLEARVAGAVEATKVAGELVATVNGVKQPTFKFTATPISPGATPPEHAGTGTVLATTAGRAKETVSSWYEKVPGWAKVSAGLGLAYVAYRRFM